MGLLCASLSTLAQHESGLAVCFLAWIVCLGLRESWNNCCSDLSHTALAETLPRGLDSSEKCYLGPGGCIYLVSPWPSAPRLPAVSPPARWGWWARMPGCPAGHGRVQHWPQAARWSAGCWGGRSRSAGSGGWPSWGPGTLVEVKRQNDTQNGGTIEKGQCDTSPHPEPWQLHFRALTSGCHEPEAAPPRRSSPGRLPSACDLEPTKINRTREGEKGDARFKLIFTRQLCKSRRNPTLRMTNLLHCVQAGAFFLLLLQCI